MVDVYILHDDDGVIRGVGHVLPGGAGRVKAVASTGRHVLQLSMGEADVSKLGHLHLTHQINIKTGLLVAKAAQ